MAVTFCNWKTVTCGGLYKYWYSDKISSYELFLENKICAKAILWGYFGVSYFLVDFNTNGSSPYMGGKSIICY